MRYETLPIESGISGDKRPYANLGKVNNRGFEITAQYNKSFLNDELLVSGRFTYTYARNKLIDRDEPVLVYPYMTNLGKPLNVNTGLVAIGLFRDEEDVKNSPTQTFSDYGVGDIKYADLNDDGKIDKNDMMQIGKPWVPQVTYGFGFNIEYKGFDLGVFFQGVGNTTITMGDIHPFNTQYSQMYKFIADSHWTEQNQNFDAAYPRMVTETATGAHNNHQVSTFWQQTGSFLKLKNIELGYSYKFARLYLIGDNLITFSKFKHWDPEIGGMEGSYANSKARGLKYPPLRTFTVGLQLNF